MFMRFVRIRHTLNACRILVLDKCGGFHRFKFCLTFPAFGAVGGRCNLIG